MSKRFLDKVKDVSKSIKKPFAKKQETLRNNENHSINEERQSWKILSQKMNTISSNAKKIQKYLGQSYTNRWQSMQNQLNSKFFNKQKNKQKQLKVGLSQMFDKGFKKAIGQQQNKKYFKKKLSEIKSKTGQVSSESMEKLKDVGKTIINQKDKMSQIGKKAAQDISQQAQKLKNQTLKKLSSTAQGKVDFVTKLMNKIFWKIALLFGLGLFAYGFGTSIPRQIRLHLTQMKDSKGNNKKELQQEQLQTTIANK